MKTFKNFNEGVLDLLTKKGREKRAGERDEKKKAQAKKIKKIKILIHGSIMQIKHQVLEELLMMPRRQRKWKIYLMSKLDLKL